MEDLKMWLLLAVVVGGSIVLAYIPIRVARERNHPNKDAITLCAIFSLFVPPLWFVAVIWAYAFRQKQERPMPPAFPVTSFGGRYKVTGVDRESGLDTTWYCQADSPANAHVKAELQGIIVTNVEPVI